MEKTPHNSYISTNLGNNNMTEEKNEIIVFEVLK